MSDAGDQENAAEPEKPPLSEYVKIKLIDQSSNEVHFRVKYKMSMGKIKKSYADRSGVGVNALRFLFDGRRINDDDTPRSLDMVEDDTVEVYQEQLGGL